MGKLTSKNFWLSALERCIKTFAQSLLSMLTVGQAIADVNWLDCLSVSAVAMLISVLTSIVALSEVEQSEGTEKE